MQIAKFENLFAFVRELVNCIMNFLAEFLIFDPPNYFVVVRLIEFCASLVDLFHGNTITVFHTAVFQDIKGTGVNGTIEKGLDLVA